MNKLIEATVALLKKARETTPEIVAVVNEVRLLAHEAGQLPPQVEQELQAIMASRTGGFIVRPASLVSLPTAPEDPQGVPDSAPPKSTHGSGYDAWYPFQRCASG